VLIAVMLLAALIGTAFAAVLLAPFWGLMKRSLWEGFNGGNPAPPPQPRTRRQIALNVVVVSGCVSLVFGIACLAVLPVSDPATILFLTWSAVGLATWMAFGRKF
jgi:uncharacterized membrane protein